MKDCRWGRSPGPRAGPRGANQRGERVYLHPAPPYLQSVVQPQPTRRPLAGWCRPSSSAWRSPEIAEHEGLQVVPVPGVSATGVWPSQRADPAYPHQAPPYLQSVVQLQAGRRRPSAVGRRLVGVGVSGWPSTGVAEHEGLQVGPLARSAGRAARHESAR
ncbi:hypothetical protein OG474_37085 [Kribbella sp. NBC_01505]|uniref:hypothetical protein n=1 Tax=Kribbella sp. NBC_01505 TaxID=2903580 RepID=UPI00386BECC3